MFWSLANASVQMSVSYSPLARQLMRSASSSHGALDRAVGAQRAYIGDGCACHHAPARCQQHLLCRRAVAEPHLGATGRATLGAPTPQHAPWHSGCPCEQWVQTFPLGFPLGSRGNRDHDMPALNPPVAEGLPVGMQHGPARAANPAPVHVRCYERLGWDDSLMQLWH